MKDESDVNLYQQFITSWNEGPLQDDPLFLKVHEMAPPIVSKWGWPDHVQDVIQNTLIQLARGKYRGTGSLDGYIKHIILHEVRHLWRKEGRKRRVEMPAELEDRRHFATEIEARLSDRTRRLLKRVPQGHQWLIEAILDADKYLTQRHAAALGNVKRSEVEKLLKELRRIWEQMEKDEQRAKAEKDEQRAKATTAGE